jgi:putative ABC transport system substrate-binding protein
MTPKRLGLIYEIAPKTSVIGLLVNPTSVQFAAQVQEMQDGTRARGMVLHVAKASTAGELDMAIAAVVQSGAAVLIEGNDPLFIEQRKHIVALTNSHKIPTIFFERGSVVDGGLMGYSSSFADSYRQVGAYVGRILKGEKPADLPVLQPIKFELVINLTTAKALGLTIPPTLLALADEVIE